MHNNLGMRREGELKSGAVVGLYNGFWVVGDRSGGSNVNGYDVRFHVIVTVGAVSLRH